MHIKSVDIYSHNLPVKNGPYTMANANVWSLETILVKITTRDGLFGWGKHAQSDQPMLKVMLSGPGQRLRKWPLTL